MFSHPGFNFSDYMYLRGLGGIRTYRYGHTNNNTNLAQ
ncbi:MAG: hypothetical protein ACI8YQ_004190 [Polaribacter sp.]|jgi:hypothetical protein